MTDRKVILFVIGFLGAYMLTSLGVLAVAIFLVVTRAIRVSPELMALLGLVSQPMSTSVGLLGGLLASTKSMPEPPPLPPELDPRNQP